MLCCFTWGVFIHACFIEQGESQHIQEIKDKISGMESADIS